MTVKDLEKYQDCLKAEKAAGTRARVEYRKLCRFVANIQDPIVRHIIINRYINGMSWTATAMKIGGGSTADTCRMAVNRYFERK